MLDINDLRWKTFRGGYGKKYDASTPLKLFEKSDDKETIKNILKDLWEELHHQGDVGLASYFSLPHLIRIGIEKKLDDWEIFGLTAVIEIQRHENNPTIPEELREDYENEIKKVIELIKINQNKKWNRTYSIAVLSAVAAVNDQIDLAKVILNLEDDDLLEKFDLFLKKYDEFSEWLEK